MLGQWIKLKYKNNNYTYIKKYQVLKVQVVGNRVFVSYRDEAEVITEEVLNDIDELLELDKDDPYQ